MGNISTITYNGEVLAETEEEGAVAVIYDGKTIANLDDGDTKPILCANTIPKTDIQIGSKTIFCAVKKMIDDIIVAVKSSFVAEPSAYTLIGKYTSSQTWTAAEDGWFQVELFGASGKGGNSATDFFLLPDETLGGLSAAGGGGGGGGAYSCSRIKMLAGDTITFGGSVAVGGTATVIINSSLESYGTMTTVSGKNGGNGEVTSYTSLGTGGAGGAGGTASGGNYENINGGTGTTGQTKKATKVFNLSAASGGAAGYTGGNAGGAGGGTLHIYDDTGSAGSKAFINIYRGNTNVVA